MTFSVTSSPENTVELGKAVLVKGGLKIAGQGNTVVAGQNTRLESITIEIKGNGNSIHIGSGCRLRGKIVLKGEGLQIRIGNLTTFQGVYLLASAGSIDIGEDCMLSRDIEIRTDDAHSVIDLATGTRINRPGSIRIGDHVWVGLRAVIQKNVSIASDCIIGSGSFVNKSCSERNVAIAGVPAKVVKRGITWDRKRQDTFELDKLWAFREKNAG